MVVKLGESKGRILCMLERGGRGRGNQFRMRIIRGMGEKGGRRVRRRRKRVRRRRKRVRRRRKRVRG